MITPDLITKALADDQPALTLLRVAVDQAAKPAIRAAHVRQKMLAQLDAAHEAVLLEEIFEKLLARSGARLRAWDPTKATFDAYIAEIAGQHADDWCLERVLPRALSGDDEAKILLYRAFELAACRRIRTVLIRRRTGRAANPETDIPDLLHGVFIKLWEENGRRFLTWNRTKGSFDLYFGTVATNYAKDESCRHLDWLLKDDEELPDFADAADGPYEQLEFRDLLRKALPIMRKRLTTVQQRQMYQLIVEERLDVEEICKRTGLSGDDVYQWRKTFRDMLKKILKDLS